MRLDGYEIGEGVAGRRGARRVLIFSVSLVLLIWKLVQLNLLSYQPSPDGSLYLSIADNFISNGKFVQTSRDYYPNMIVPPGYPAILVVLKLLLNSVDFLVFVQILVFGLSNVLIAEVADSQLQWLASLNSVYFFNAERSPSFTRLPAD